MEEAIQEVDSVSSQNTANDETQSEDENLTMAEYASNLLKAQTKEEESSEQTEGESESAEQAAEEEDRDESDGLVVGGGPAEEAEGRAESGESSGSSQLRSGRYSP